MNILCWPLLVVFGIIVCRVSGISERTANVDKDVLSRLDILEKEGQELRMHMSRQNEQVKKLQKLVQSQTQIINGLKGTIEDQDAIIRTLLSSDKHNAKSDESNGVELTEQKMQEHKEGIRPARVLMEGPVAFHARIDKYPVAHLNPNDKIPFDVVLTNIGGGYNQNTSVFVAPVTGIYIFSTSVLTEHAPHKLVQAGLKKNGLLLARVYGYADSAHDQGSVTVATKLDAGDQVWVSLRGPADDSIWGDSFTSFSGCLVMMV